mmetsp:Transcript_57752/g.182970  ORF Transcript_57752/g.182970 Transcript_57752/m.182970 type:complete len:223 (+) Transcript_57752:641-1309(+)
MIGLKFRNLNVPQHARITSARLGFYSEENSVDGGDDGGAGNFGDVRVSIHGVDEASPSNFDDDDDGRDYPSNQRLTNAMVTWTMEIDQGWNNKGDKALSPDISPIVQEIVDRADWQKESHMSFVIKDDILKDYSHRFYPLAERKGERSAYSKDEDSSKAPCAPPTPPPRLCSISGDGGLRLAHGTATLEGFGPLIPTPPPPSPPPPPPPPAPFCPPGKHSRR